MVHGGSIGPLRKYSPFFAFFSHETEENIFIMASSAYFALQTVQLSLIDLNAQIIFKRHLS